MRKKFPKKIYPFSDALCQFMNIEPLFFKSLKLYNSQRFKFFGPILTSHTPANHPKSEDEVIGMFYFDKINFKQNKIFLKQDFVINIKKLNTEFISFSANNTARDNPYVKPIKVFFEMYGNNEEFYHNGNRWQHHYNQISELPHKDLKLNAEKIFKKYSS